MADFSKINLDNVKGVLVDLDNTIYNYAACNLAALEKCHAEFNFNLDLYAFIEKYEKFSNLIAGHHGNHGSMKSRLITFMKMAESINMEKPYRIAMKLETVYWESLSEKMEFYPDGIEFMKKAKSLGCKICLIADSISNLQIRKMQKHGISEFIDYIVTAEEAGAEKPNFSIFVIGLQKLKCDISEAIMIGDDYIMDIEPAESLGIKAYQV